MAEQGKYDDAADIVLKAEQAEGVFLMVFGGPRGPGMAFTATPAAYAAIRAHLPDFLRRIAEAIEKENKTPEAVGGAAN